LNSLRYLVGSPVEWRHAPKKRRTLEVWAQNEVVGRVVWPGLIGQDAHAVCADGEWLFDAQGIASRTIAITTLATEQPVAVMHSAWLSGRGTVEVLAGPTTYEWLRTSFLLPERCFLNSHGSALVRIKTRFPGARIHGTIFIEPAGGADPNLPLLTLLGVYFQVLRSRRAAKG
jgi:hypothetical protein